MNNTDKDMPEMSELTPLDMMAHKDCLSTAPTEDNSPC